MRHKWKTIYTEHCHYCGSTINTFRHFMGPALVAFLVLLPSDKSVVWGRSLYPESLKASPDAGYLIYFGLVRREKKGYYAITDRGISFLWGEIEVACWVDARLTKIINTAKETIGIAEARG